MPPPKRQPSTDGSLLEARKKRALEEQTYAARKKAAPGNPFAQAIASDRVSNPFAQAGKSFSLQSNKYVDFKRENAHWLTTDDPEEADKSKIRWDPNDIKREIMYMDVREERPPRVEALGSADERGRSLALGTSINLKMQSVIRQMTAYPVDAKGGKMRKAET